MQYHAIGFDDSVGKVPGQSEFPDCPERCVRTFNKESTLIGHCDHKKNAIYIYMPVPVPGLPTEITLSVACSL